MAVPFPEAELEILVYMMFGALIALFFAGLIYIRKLHSIIEQQSTEDEEHGLRVDNIALSKKAEDVMNVVLEDPLLQSELPDELNVSKATISNAVSELFERNLVIKKKKANTYLIEPNIEELGKQQR